MAKDPFSLTSDWMSFQQKYWDALNAFNPTETASDTSTSSPADIGMKAWSEALDSWWKSASPKATQPVQDFYARLIDQGKSYFQMSEQLGKAFQSSAAAGQSATQWQDALNETLNAMKEAFSSPSQYSQDAVRKWMGLWELPVDHWQHVASSLSMMPGDFLQGLNTVDLSQMTESMHGQVDQFLSIPGVGHMRERQGLYQELIRLGMNYQNALQEYMRAYNEIGVKSVEKLQARFSDMEKGEVAVDSIRGLYDLWVDCCEEVYADYVNSDKYVRIHGEVVNTLMALKQHNGMIVDEILEAFNIPTRPEINTLQQRCYQLWRDNKTLHREMQALKEQFDAANRTTGSRNSTTKSRPTKKSVRAAQAAAKPAEK